jgi:non-ribosomal peptide synthase protein (TIGR01720 family)
VSEAVLAGLTVACTRWTGGRALLVEVEGHGREDLFADVDLSHTVGWFTSLFPLLLELGAAESDAEILATVKAQVRSVPDGGIGYGLLCHLSGDAEIGRQLAALPAPGVLFNALRLPRSGRGVAAGGWEGLQAAEEPCGPMQDPRELRTHALEVEAVLGGPTLKLRLRFAAAHHRRATIEALAGGILHFLRRLAAPAARPLAAWPPDRPEVQSPFVGQL